MVVKFVLTTDDKQKYHELKRRIFFSNATITRETVRELKNDFHADLEVLSFGRYLFLEIKESGKCKTLRLDPNIDPAIMNGDE